MDAAAPENQRSGSAIRQAIVPYLGDSTGSTFWRRCRTASPGAPERAYAEPEPVTAAFPRREYSDMGIVRGERSSKLSPRIERCSGNPLLLGVRKVTHDICIARFAADGD